MISSSSDFTGNAGSVALTAGGALQISNGGEVSASTFGAGNAGSVSVAAGSLAIDGGSSPLVTAISSNAEPLTTGNAGNVSVNVTGLTKLTDNGQITADTFSTGAGGNVSLNSGSLLIDGTNTTSLTGISSNTDSLSAVSGNAGSIAVTVSGATQILNGGVISTNTFSSGNAGDITLTTGSLSVDGTNAPAPTGQPIPTGLSSTADAFSSGNAGRVTVDVTGATMLSNGGSIISATLASGRAGDVNLTTGSLTIADSANSDAATGITTTAYPGSSGDAGRVSVQASGATNIADGGSLASATYGSGNAGDVTLTSGSLTIDGGNSIFVTGLASSALPGASGNAGRVSVTVADATNITNGGQLSSDTAGMGQAGERHARQQYDDPVQWRCHVVRHVRRWVRRQCHLDDGLVDDRRRRFCVHGALEHCSARFDRQRWTRLSRGQWHRDAVQWRLAVFGDARQRKRRQRRFDGGRAGH